MGILMWVGVCDRGDLSTHDAKLKDDGGLGICGTTAVKGFADVVVREVSPVTPVVRGNARKKL